MEDYKKITLESYNINSDIFSKRYAYLFDFERRKEFNRFLTLLIGKKVLDLGCGPGEHLSWFKKQGLDVTGVDISPAMIAKCREKGINSVLMDMEYLDFNENAFDGIWAVCSLIHISKNKLEGVVKKTHSILKNKGIMFVTLKKGEGETLVADKLNPLTKRYFVYWKRDEFEKLLKDYFDIIEFWEEDVEGSTLLNFFLRNRK